MINSKELRTGNLIYRLDNVSEVDWATIKLCAQRNKQFNEDWKPIPLTPEWLERFCLPIDGQVSKSAYWYNTSNNFLCEDYSEGDGGTHIIAKIEYVHQLQNLYFALTGTELILKQ